MNLRDLFKPKPRETESDRAQWLEGTLQRAAGIAQQRILSDLRAAQRGFETADTPAWTASWSTVTSEINEDLAMQLPTLRARSLDQARNNEWVAAYLIQLEDNLLGPSGIQLQMRLTQIDGTAQDREANRAAEAAWVDWGKRGNCDVTGKLTWREFEALAVGTLARSGELLYRLRPGAGGIHNFKVQMLNPALIDVTLKRDWGGNRVRMGVEINDDGKPVAYWLRAHKSGDAMGDFVSVGKHVRVPAEDLRHCFLVEEPDQLRGIPWLTIGARRLHLVHDFEEAAAVASSNAAKRAGFFVSPSGDAPPGFADTIVSSVLDAARTAGKVLTPEEIQQITSAAEKFNTVVPGQFDTIPQGYDFRAYDSKWPDVNGEGYIKQQVRGWSAARGMSYVTVGNDLEAVNFSSARVGIVAEREHFKTLQNKLVDWLHDDVAHAWMRSAVVADKRLQPSRLAAMLVAISWQPRRWEGIDPVKEANANETNLKLGLTSRRRIILGRGEDPDEIAEEIAAEEKLYGPLNPDTTPQPAVEPEPAPAQPARRLSAVRGHT